MSEYPNQNTATGVSEREKPVNTVAVAPEIAAISGNPELNLDEVVAYIQECRENARRWWEKRRKVWDELWEQYAMTEDLSYKKPWESKTYIPKSHAAVKKGVSFIRHILLRQDTYFDFTPVTVKDNPLIPAMKKAVEINHRNMAGGQRFLNVALETVEWSFALGFGVMKMWGEYEPEYKVVIQPRFDEAKGEYYNEVRRDKYYRWRLAAKALDPRTVWVDHEERFFIEESYIPLADLRDLAAGPTPMYNPAQVALLEDSDYGREVEDEQRLRDCGLEPTPNAYIKSVFLQEFWGDVYSKDGKRLKSNGRVVVANKRWVLNPPTVDEAEAWDNPFWHGKRPYIMLNPVNFLGRLMGFGLYESSASLQKAINNLTRMSLDGMMWRLMKILQVIRDRVENEDELKKLGPGSVLEIRGDGPAVTEVQFSDLPGSAITEGEILHRYFQEGTGVTDFMSGLPLAKGETTATENTLKTQQGNQYFESIARSIEEQLMEPAIEMTRQLLVQFWDALDPRMADLIPDQSIPIDQMAREDRIRFLQTDVDIVSRGISSYFEKADGLKNLLNVLQIAGKIPDMYARLKVPAVLDRIFSYVQLADTAQLVKTDEEIAQEKQQAMQQQQQMMAMAQAQGGNISPQEMQQAIAMIQQAGLPPDQAFMALQQALAQHGQSRPQGIEAILEQVNQLLAQLPPEMRGEVIPSLKVQQAGQRPPTDHTGPTGHLAGDGSPGPIPGSVAPPSSPDIGGPGVQ